MSKKNVTVAILGLNRITASIGLALRAYSQNPKGGLTFRVVGQADEPEHLRSAEKVGAVDEAVLRLVQAVKDADIVLLAASAGEQATLYEVIGDRLKPGAVVLDLSPFKAPALTHAEKFFPRNAEGNLQAYVVGLQPILQSPEVYADPRQIETARENLLSGSEMIIAPAPNCPPSAVKLASDLTEILNMNPRFLEPHEYDGLADMTETIPALLRFLLFAGVIHTDGRHEIERVVSPGFAQMVADLRHTRPEELRALLERDPAQTRRHVDELITVLEDLRNALHKPETLDTFIEETLTAFKDWETRRDSGEWEAHPADVGIDSGMRASFFGSMFGFGRTASKKPNQTR